MTDHRSEGASLAQLAPQHLHLAERLLAFDDFLEKDLQSLRIDRLGQVIVGPDLDGLDRRFDRALAGQDDGGDVAVLLLQAAHELEPVHPGHGKITDDDPRPERRDLAQRLFTVRRRVRDEAPRPHQLGQPVARRRVVLDEEQTFTEAGCGHAVDFEFRDGVHLPRLSVFPNRVHAPARAVVGWKPVPVCGALSVPLSSWGVKPCARNPHRYLSP